MTSAHDFSVRSVTVEVKGSKGDKYIVTLDPEMWAQGCRRSIGCTCKAAAYRSWPCKHMRMVELGEGGKPHVRIQMRPHQLGTQWQSAARVAGTSR